MEHARCATPIQRCRRLFAGPLENALGDRDQSNAGTMSTRVRHILVEHLGQSVLTLDAACTALAVSRRTLTRRLAEEGASFRQILDDVRRDFARALLRSTQSIGDIAFFLQYSEPAAFHRSFRRWTGLTPQAFRESGPLAGYASASRQLVVLASSSVSRYLLMRKVLPARCGLPERLWRQPVHA